MFLKNNGSERKEQKGAVALEDYVVALQDSLIVLGDRLDAFETRLTWSWSCEFLGVLPDDYPAAWNV